MAQEERASVLFVAVMSCAEFSLVVDEANYIMSVAISRVLIHGEYFRLPQCSLASLAHLLGLVEVGLRGRV